MNIHDKIVKLKAMNDVLESMQKEVYDLSSELSSTMTYRYCMYKSTKMVITNFYHDLEICIAVRDDGCWKKALTVHIKDIELLDEFFSYEDEEDYLEDLLSSL